MSPESNPRAGSLFVRVSPDDIVVYASNATAQYLRAKKDDLVGAPLEVLAGRCEGEVAACFARPETGRVSNRLVADAAGRVFEARTYSEGGVLDIILDEVSTPEVIAGPLNGTTGTPIESLDEDEIRTVRQPERRYISVSRVRLHDMDALAARIPPFEARMMLDSFFEEAADAIMENGCTVGSITGESLTGVFGAPRLFADHPLRAVRAACETMAKAARLHEGFARQGKEVPPCSVGIWTGETLVGSFGCGAGRHYTALGTTVQMARDLSRLARPGEILLPEHTLFHLLRVLPEGWGQIRAESEFEPDLSDFQWSGDEVVPLPEELRKAVYLVGPGIDEDAGRAEFYFDYLWAIKVRGQEAPVPVLRVTRPSQIGDSIELSSDNVISETTHETLGKYRLLEILGTGGMGRVWRGVDRFGNSVAIKVLHGSEQVSESQLKRFRREAEVMARLPHRNICRVYEMNEFEGIQYIAMEYVEGLSLAELLYGGASSASAAADLPSLIRSLRAEKSSRSQSGGGTGEDDEDAAPRPEETLVLPVQQSLAIVLKVCEAIQFAHEHGVLHRDLKPGNILLREDGEPLVADFGLAKLSTPDATHSLSMSGHMVGTLENMPPEQAESSKDVDERADVYAIGTILFQMLTGHRHFKATGNIVADAQALKTHEPPRLRTFNPRIDPDLEIITLKALRNDPAQRYRSVSALRADLERYLRGDVISAKPVSALDLVRKLILRNKAITAVTAVSLALIIATVTLALFSLSRQLSNEQAARREAEKLRARAEASEIAAEARQKEAEQSALLAREAAEKAEKALVAKQVAELAASNANKITEEARAETESERQKREQLEQEARRLAGEAEEARRKLAQSREQSAADRQNFHPEPRPDAALPSGPSPSDLMAARRAISDAAITLTMELSPYELERFDKQPEIVLTKVSRAIERVSDGLLIDPDFPPGWMIKGRLHLALMEFSEASAAFEQAAKASAARPDLPHSEDPTRLLEYARAAAPTFGSRATALTAPLLSSDSEMDRTAGRVMAYFAAKPQTQKPFAAKSSPLGRTPSPGEIVLALRAQNPGSTVKATQRGDRSMDIVVSGDVPNLAPLAAAPVTSLSVLDAGVIDWAGIPNLALESLAVTNSLSPDLPVQARFYSKLKSLDLSGSMMPSFEIIRLMPQLESLNLANCPAGDLAPLAFCRRLRTLDISGADRSNVRTLLLLPLESLTLSPEAITDSAGVGALTGHRTLKTLRAPSDPRQQSPTVFRQKHLPGGR